MYNAIITWIHNIGVPLLGWFALFTVNCWETYGSFPEIGILYVCEYTVSPQMTEYHSGGFGKKIITMDEYGNMTVTEGE